LRFAKFLRLLPGKARAAWLLDLTAIGLVKDPALSKFTGRVSDSGEGRWTIKAAIDEAVPVPVLSAALYQRFTSRGDEYWLGEGHVEKAAGHAQLLANSCRHKAPKYIAMAHRVRAEIAARRGDLAEAEKELSHGIAVLREHPAALEGWKIQAALGRLHRRAGNSEGSRLAFAEASAIIRSIAGNTSTTRCGRGS